MWQISRDRTLWYLAVFGVAVSSGLASALSALLLTGLQSRYDVAGALLLSPLVLGPLASAFAVYRILRPTRLFDRLFGGVMFAILAYVAMSMFVGLLLSHEQA